MNDAHLELIPDRMSIDELSPHYGGPLLRQINVYYNGIRQTTVNEYCISEGWIKRLKMSALGKIVLERGNRVITHHNGEVKVTWKKDD